MRRSLARFRSLLCLAMAFALLVPAAASSAHNLTHGMSVIAADHGAHAGTASHGADQRDHAPAPDKQDGGHDHLLSLSMPLAALFDETPVLNPPLPASAPLSSRVATLALRAAEPPPADPPRAA